MKAFKNSLVRICLLLIAISLIGIIYTIYYAKTNNGVAYNSYAQLFSYGTINNSSNLTISQIYIIVILSASLVFGVSYLIYSKLGKLNFKELFKDKERKTLFVIETILLTIFVTLIIVIGSNSFILNNPNQNNNINTNTYSSNDGGSRA